MVGERGVLVRARGVLPHIVGESGECFFSCLVRGGCALSHAWGEEGVFPLMVDERKVCSLPWLVRGGPSHGR